MIARRRRRVNPKTRAGGEVKGQIYAAGLRLLDVAAAAGVSPTNLTQHIQCRRTSHAAKVKIWRAFCRLTGQSVSIEEFWGDLWEDVA